MTSSRALFSASVRTCFPHSCTKGRRRNERTDRADNLNCNLNGGPACGAYVYYELTLLSLTCMHAVVCSSFTLNNNGHWAGCLPVSRCNSLRAASKGSGKNPGWLEYWHTHYHIRAFAVNSMDYLADFNWFTYTILKYYMHYEKWRKHCRLTL